MLVDPEVDHDVVARRQALVGERVPVPGPRLDRVRGRQQEVEAVVAGELLGPGHAARGEHLERERAPRRTGAAGGQGSADAVEQGGDRRSGGVDGEPGAAAEAVPSADQVGPGTRSSAGPAGPTHGPRTRRGRPRPAPASARLVQTGAARCTWPEPRHPPARAAAVTDAPCDLGACRGLVTGGNNNWGAGAMSTIEQLDDEVAATGADTFRGLLDRLNDQSVRPGKHFDAYVDVPWDEHPIDPTDPRWELGATTPSAPRPGTRASPRRCERGSGSTWSPARCRSATSSRACSSVASSSTPPRWPPGRPSCATCTTRSSRRRSTR